MAPGISDAQFKELRSKVDTFGDAVELAEAGQSEIAGLAKKQTDSSFFFGKNILGTKFKAREKTVDNSMEQTDSDFAKLRSIVGGGGSGMGSSDASSGGNGAPRGALLRPQTSPQAHARCRLAQAPWRRPGAHAARY